MSRGGLERHCVRCSEISSSVRSGRLTSARCGENTCCETGVAHARIEAMVRERNSILPEAKNIFRVP